MTNPYRAPDSAVLDPAVGGEAAAQIRRPALIWITHLLLLFIGAAGVYGVVEFAPTLARALAAGIPPWRIGLGLLLQASIPTACATLFYGLVRRRRWSWAGSVGFALLFLVLVLVSQITQPKGSLPQFEIKPGEEAGAAVGRVIGIALVVVYPIRLYFSQKVRRFLGVPQRR